MKLKSNHGALEIKGLGLRLTQASSEDEIKRALKHAPEIAKYIDGAKETKDGQTKTK